MAAYKEPKTNTWRVIYRYTDWTGKKKQTQKRGFATKKEALAWEREQLNKATSDLEMTLSSFAEIYTEDMKSRLKENTWHTKEHIIRSKILPYFGNRRMCDIQPKDIIAWQNKMLNGKDKNGKAYSPVYLKTLHNQLSALFNHAVKFYGLSQNPAAKVGNMGKAKGKEMQFWTQEEYKAFSFEMMDKPLSFYAFELLYWCGIREGELLALTPADFDFDKKTVSINNEKVDYIWDRIQSRGEQFTYRINRESKIFNLIRNSVDDSTWSRIDMVLEEIENAVPYQQIYIDKSQNQVDDTVEDERLADVEAKARMLIDLAESIGSNDTGNIIDELFKSEPFINYPALKQKLKEEE